MDFNVIYILLVLLCSFTPPLLKTVEIKFYASGKLITMQMQYNRNVKTDRPSDHCSLATNQLTTKLFDANINNMWGFEAANIHVESDLPHSRRSALLLNVKLDYLFARCTYFVLELLWIRHSGTDDFVDFYTMGLIGAVEKNQFRYAVIYL